MKFDRVIPHILEKSIQCDTRYDGELRYITLCWCYRWTVGGLGDAVWMMTSKCTKTT